MSPDVETLGLGCLWDIPVSGRNGLEGEGWARTRDRDLS